MLLVLSTFPDAAAAESIAGQLIEARLAACVNLVPGIASLYEWQGQRESSREVLAIIKTTEERAAALEAFIQRSHPYEVPEIVAVPVVRAAAAYAAWVRDRTTA